MYKIPIQQVYTPSVSKSVMQKSYLWRTFLTEKRPFFLNSTCKHLKPIIPLCKIYVKKDYSLMNEFQIIVSKMLNYKDLSFMLSYEGFVWENKQFHDKFQRIQKNFGVNGENG